MKLRRDLMIVLGLLVVGWLVLMAGLAKLQRSRAAENVSVEPKLIHYPGTEGVEEQTSSNLGFHKYWFQLKEDYPSLSVFYFYQKQLQPEGWKLVGTAAPNWVQQESKDELLDIFRATWLGPKGLFQLDLEMMSTVKIVPHEVGTATEQREPGIKVYVTLRRAMFPGFPMPQQDQEPTRPPGEIEVK